MKHMLESRLLEEISITLDTQKTLTLMAESEEELKSLLMKVKVKVELKAQHSENEDHGIWFHHFMANRREKSGSSDRFYFIGFQNHCSW